MCSKFSTALLLAYFIPEFLTSPVNRTQLKSLFPEMMSYGFYYYQKQAQHKEIPGYDPILKEPVYLQMNPIPQSGSYVPTPKMTPIWYPPKSQFPVYHPLAPMGLTKEDEEQFSNDPTDRMDPLVHYAILKYMPTIPLELADTLYDMEPNYVKYILYRHQYLPQLLMSMDSTTLNYVLLIGDLGEKIRQFAIEDVHNLFYKMDSPCAYILVQKQDIKETIIAKAPHLASCKIAQLPLEIDTVNSTPTAA